MNPLLKERKMIELTVSPSGDSISYTCNRSSVCFDKSETLVLYPPGTSATHFCYSRTSVCSNSTLREERRNLSLARVLAWQQRLRLQISLAQPLAPDQRLGEGDGVGAQSDVVTTEFVDIPVPSVSSLLPLCQMTHLSHPSCPGHKRTWSHSHGPHLFL